MPWHTITPLDSATFRIAEPLGAVEPRYGIAGVNMHLVLGRERAALIDTGLGIGDLGAVVRELTSLPVEVLNTHSHWDHCGANALFSQRAIHALEAGWVAEEPDMSELREAMQQPAAQAALPPGFEIAAYRIAALPATRHLSHDEVIDLGGRALRVVHTPGHAPGHVAFWDEANGILFSGDAAYRGPMFACFEGCDPAAFTHSLRTLAALPNVRRLYPGHEEVIEDGQWLAHVARCAEAALQGAAPHRVHEGFMTGREFQFDGFAIWLPLPPKP